MSPRYIILSVLLITVTEFPGGHCKSLQRNATSVSAKQRRIDNFVDFTDEGDQLAVESSADKRNSEVKREVLQQKSPKTSTGRDCANVQQAIYPIIPVIIAAVIGLVGSIIIAAIAKLIIKGISSKDESEYDSSSGYGYGQSGYGKRSGYSFFGLENVDFYKLTKRVLNAIDKVY